MNSLTKAYINWVRKEFGDLHADNHELAVSASKTARDILTLQFLRLLDDYPDCVLEVGGKSVPIVRARTLHETEWQIVRQTGTLLDRLKHLRDHGPNLSLGIYSHVVKAGDYEYKKLQSIARRWNKFSGCSEYPVPGVGKFKGDPIAAYRYLNKWEGEYGDLRWELLDLYIDIGGRDEENNQLEESNCS